MAINRGKQFEDIVKAAFIAVKDVSIDRIHDQTTGFAGSKNICDFIVYKEPYEYYIECKSVHGNTLPFSNITDTQWQGLLSKADIKGVFAGILCWWVDKDVTKFIDIETLECMRLAGVKSIRYDYTQEQFNQDRSIVDGLIVEIEGKKKRVFFEYNMESFFKEVNKNEY